VHGQKQTISNVQDVVLMRTFQAGGAIENVYSNG